MVFYCQTLFRFTRDELLKYLNLKDSLGIIGMQSDEITIADLPEPNIQVVKTIQLGDE